LQKESSNLLLSVDIHNENQIFATGGLSGKLKIETGINTSTYNVKKIIHKVLFVPNQGVHIKIAVATRGMGVLIIDTSK